MRCLLFSSDFPVGFSTNNNNNNNNNNYNVPEKFKHVTVPSFTFSESVRIYSKVGIDRLEQCCQIVQIACGK